MNFVTGKGLQQTQYPSWFLLYLQKKKKNIICHYNVGITSFDVNAVTACSTTDSDLGLKWKELYIRFQPDT